MTNARLLAWLFACASGACGSSADHPQSKPYDELLDGVPAPRTVTASLSIDELLAEYEANQFAAAAKYETSVADKCHNAGFFPEDDQSIVSNDRCRVIEVPGVVQAMGRDSFGVAFIALQSKSSATLRARFRGPVAERGLPQIRPGESIRVQCEPIYDPGRYAAPGLILTDCEIAQKANDRTK